MQNTAITQQQLQLTKAARGQGRTGKGLIAQEGEMVDPFLQIIMNLISQDQKIQIGQESLSQGGASEIAALLQNQSQGMQAFDLLGLFRANSLSQTLSSTEQNLLAGLSDSKSLSLEEILAQILQPINEGEAQSLNANPLMAEIGQILPKTVEQTAQNSLAAQQPENELTALAGPLKVQVTTSPEEADDGVNEGQVKARNLEKTASKPGAKDERTEELDVDALQSRVSQNKVSSPFELKFKSLETTDELELKDQISQGIKENVSLGKSEFVLKLKPESLGEITVKLVEEAGKTSVTISTLSAQTAKLINSELQALKLNLAPMNAEVSEAVVQTQPSYTQGFDMSYQQFNQQQFGNGQFFDGRSRDSFTVSGFAGAEGAEAAGEISTVYTSLSSSKRLDAYV